MLLQADAALIPLADNSVDLIFTDPPYSKKYLHCYESLAREATRVLKDGKFVLAMCGGLYLNEIMRMFDDVGLQFYWEYRAGLTGWAAGCVWPRGNTQVNIITRGKPILAYSKGDGLPRMSTLDVYYGGGKDKKYHHWGQDVASARYFIDCFSSEGDIVLDPFVGGGTTLVACELLDRRWVGSDLDRDACRISADRIDKEDIYKALPLFAKGTT